VTAGFLKDGQYRKFALYGFFKNLRFFDPYLLLFFLESGLDYFHIGLLFSIREISIYVLEVPTGFLADLVGRRRTMMSAFAVYIVSFLVFYITRGFGPYAGAMVLFAAAEALRTGTHKAMIIDYLKRKDMESKKVRYYGATRGWSQLGSALSALIAGFLVFFSGSYRTVFIYTLIPYAAGFSLMLRYPKYLDFSGEYGEGEKGGVLKGLRENFRDVMQGLREMLRDRQLRRGFLHSSFGSAVFKTVKDYIQPMMRNLAVTLPLFSEQPEHKRISVVVGIVYFFIYLMTSAASRHAGTVEDMFSSRVKALNVSYLVLVAAVAVVALFVESAFLAVGIGVFVGLYLLENLRRPMTVGYLGEVVKGKTMATGLSLESQLKTIIVALLSPAFGLLTDRWGLGSALTALAIVSLIIYPFLRVGDTEPRAAKG